MAQLLSDALVETFGEWQAEVTPAWRALLADVELAGAAVNPERKLDPWTGIFPVPKSRTPPLGSPKSAHTFRALDGLAPEDVRVIIIGQDPYPDVAKATGRSFEQGGLKDWDKDAHRVAPSLRGILQSAAAAHTGRDSYRQKTQGWNDLLADLRHGKLTLAQPPDLFDRYQRQGVLWLNTTLSISRFDSDPDHQKEHLAFWSPFINALLKGVLRARGRVAFALWGGWAKSYENDLNTWAADAGATIAIATDEHPVRDEFLVGPNTLVQTNASLQAWNEAPVTWLPN